jgi:hypothetical protein
MTTLPANRFQDQVQSLLDDWRGQDEMFFHDRCR